MPSLGYSKLKVPGKVANDLVRIRVKAQKSASMCCLG
jgi:hypothetical protein